MARIPNTEEIEFAQKQTENAIEKKRYDQEKKGKNFVIDEHGHAPGVIPEKVWKNLKNEETK